MASARLILEHRIQSVSGAIIIIIIIFGGALMLTLLLRAQ